MLCFDSCNFSFFYYISSLPQYYYYYYSPVTSVTTFFFFHGLGIAISLFGTTVAVLVVVVVLGCGGALRPHIIIPLGFSQFSPVSSCSLFSVWDYCGASYNPISLLDTG
ncbi:hypothetical protein Dimus_018979 [Dionaea muscipula]